MWTLLKARRHVLEVLHPHLKRWGLKRENWPSKLRRLLQRLGTRADQATLAAKHTWLWIRRCRGHSELRRLEKTSGITRNGYGTMSHNCRPTEEQVSHPQVRWRHYTWLPWLLTSQWWTSINFQPRIIQFYLPGLLSSVFGSEQTYQKNVITLQGGVFKISLFLPSFPPSLPIFFLLYLSFLYSFVYLSSEYELFPTDKSQILDFFKFLF